MAKKATAPLTAEEAMKAIEGSRKGVDPKELGLSLIQEFGGVSGFSKEFIKIYKSPKTGATAKVKMIEAILRLASQGKGDHMATMLARASTEELRLKAQQLLGGNPTPAPTLAPPPPTSIPVLIEGDSGTPTQNVRSDGDE